MARFVRTLCGSMVNLSDVLLIRPFETTVDAGQWDEVCSEHDLAWIKTREVVVLVLRHEPGGEQFAKRATFFADEDAVNEIHAAYVPAEPGWGVVLANSVFPPEPVVAWAMPSGLPIVANRGIINVGLGFQLVKPDGTRTRPTSQWKPDPETGKLVELRWEDRA